MHEDENTIQNVRIYFDNSRDTYVLEITDYYTGINEFFSDKLEGCAILLMNELRMMRA